MAIRIKCPYNSGPHSQTEIVCRYEKWRDKLNVRQATKVNTDLELSVQFCGAISVRNDDLRYNFRWMKMILKG